MSRSTWLAVVAVLTLLVACGPDVENPSPSAGSGSEATDRAAGNLPPGCEPIDLRSLDGSPVDLEGEWVDVSRDDAGTMTWFIRTAGNCFYGVGMVTEFTDYSDLFTVQSFNGEIRSDFTIEGAFVHLGPGNSFETSGEYVPATLLIDLADDGTIAIREDRDPNVLGPRCPRPEQCVPPMELR